MTPSPLSRADLSSLEVVFTDVDGTLTTGGKLRASTLGSLEALGEAGLKVVLVTGRPAGWAEAFARNFPVDAVIAENGGVYFAPDARGKLRKIFVEGTAQPENRAQLERDVAAVLKQFPAARLSMDSANTEVDLAIDHHEDARLPPAQLDALEAALHARGVTAVRSSVHVNCWRGRFDKRSTVERYLKATLKTRLGPDDRRFAYVGDSFNDAPLFGAFPLSVGVANVRPLLPTIAHPPRFITKLPEGKGFEEFARAVLRQRRMR